MGNPRLIFSSTSNQSGLTNAAISASNDKDAAVIIRELLQNSFDSAIDDAKKQQAEVKFIIDTIEKSEIPGLDEYEKALQAIEKEKLSEQENDILGAIKEELSLDKIPVLYVVDNGIGFNQKTLISILSDGISEKSDPMNSGGSYGNGHFSAFNISNLRYVVYGGKSSDNSMVCSGQAILRTHLDNEDLKSGAGFLRIQDKPLLERNDIFLKDNHIPSSIKNELDKLDGSGAIVAILGFNFFGLDINKDKTRIIDLISSAIVRNFFVAISEGHLNVDIIWEEESVSVHKTNLENIFYETENEKSKPQFFTAKRFYDLLSRGHEQIIETKEGPVKIYYLKEETNSTQLALCRNGMWIDSSIPPPLNVGSFAGIKPFSALILPQRDTELSALIKRAEGNLHMDLRLNRFSYDKAGREKKQRLQEALDKIKEHLVSIIGKNDNDSFSVDIPELTINMLGSAETKRKNERKAPKVAKSKDKKRPVEGGSGKPEGGKGKKDKSKEKRRIGNPFDSIANLNARHNIRKKEAYVKFKIDKNATNLLLSLRLDDGTDPTCDNYTMTERLKIKNATCNGNPCQIMDHDTIDIGKTESGTLMDLVVDYETDIKGDYTVNYEFNNSALKKDNS